MNQPGQHVIVFSRYPEAGVSKTRLIPVLGPAGAARLQKRLTEHTVEAAQRLRGRGQVAVSLHYCGGSREEAASWLAVDAHHEQAGGDLGNRMRGAFTAVFRQGSERAVLVGSDIPDISAEIIGSALELLGEQEVVIGPSLDGGYYLIGLAKARNSELLALLFERMRWSTPYVYRDTVARLHANGIEFARLPCLQDVDGPADLHIITGRGWL